MSKSLFFATILALALAACSGGGGSRDEVKTGVFVDAPTAGLVYETPTLRGVTTASGEFRYRPGETVSFRVGALTLGAASGGAVLTPLEITGQPRTDHPDVLRVVRLLLTLDDDENPANGITVDAATAARFPPGRLADFADLGALLQRAGVARSPVSTVYAQQHLKLSLQSIAGQPPRPRYTQLDAASGQPLDDAGVRAGCVSDAYTGLQWEAKSADGLRDARHRYLPAMRRGARNEGQCDPELSTCLADDYVDAVNAQRLCGHDDWRVPSEAELRTLLDFSQQDSAKALPALDRAAFPDALPTFYWTGTMHRVEGFLAVWFDDTHKTLARTSLAKDRYGTLRLVRGTPIPDAPNPDDVPQPAFIPLSAAGRPATPGEAVACVDVNDDTLVNPRKTELFLLAPSAPGDAANQVQDAAALQRLIAERNAARFCGKDNWRLPDGAEMSQLLTMAINPAERELPAALPRLDAAAAYWVNTTDGPRAVSVHADAPVAASRARVLLYSSTPRPAFVRKKPGPNVRPGADELAAWRSAYARYRPGSATQPDWPAPLLDDTVRAGFADLGLLPPVPFPADNPYSPAKVELGQKLFFDPRLSRNNTISCASCHDPRSGWSDSRELSQGHVGQQGTRNAMTILNTAYVKELFWDGRARSLEEQALGPIANPDEMHQPLERAVAKVAAEPEYAPLFAAAFGDARVDSLRIARAVATFERTLISHDSAFDRFLKGEAGALSDDALWGLQLFRTKARCINCHNTPLFSDNRFHSNGLHYYGGDLEDLGRYLVTGRAGDVGHFRTPTLRDILYSGNYMHNGAFPMGDGAGVLMMYDAGMVQTLPTGLFKYDPLYPKTSPEVQSLGLTAMERAALFEFMKAISAPPRSGPASEDELFRR